MNYLTSTAYHPSKNELTDGFIGTIIARIWHYVAQPQLSDTGTFKYSNWRMPIASQCITLYIWRSLGWFSRDIRWFDYNWCLEDVTNWRHSSYISLCATSTIDSPLSSSAREGRWAIKDSATAIQSNNDKKICNEPHASHTGQYVYIDCTAVTTSDTERVATDSYSKSMFSELTNSEESKFR